MLKKYYWVKNGSKERNKVNVTSIYEILYKVLLLSVRCTFIACKISRTQEKNYVLVASKGFIFVKL